MDNIFEALGFAFKGKVSMEETASDHFEQIPTAVDPQETATFIDKLEDDHEGVNQERRADETLPEENVADEIAREIEAIEKEGALDENLSGEGNDIMDIPENPKAEKMGGIAPVASDEERAPEVIEKIKENSKPNQTTIDDTGFAGNKEVEHMMAEQNGQEYAEHNENQSVFSDAENETEVTSADKMYVQVPGDNGNDEFKSLEEAQGDHGSTETNDTPSEKKSVSIGDIQGDTSTILDADGGVEDASGSGDYDSTDDYSDETDEVEEEDAAEDEEIEEEDEEIAKEDVDTETEDEKEEEVEESEETEEEAEEVKEEEAPEEADEAPETPEEPTEESEEPAEEADGADEAPVEAPAEGAEEGSATAEVNKELALLDSIEFKGVLGGDNEDLEAAKSNLSNQSEDSSTSFDNVSTMKSVNTADGNQEFSTEEMPDGTEQPKEGKDTLASTVTELASQDENFDADKVTINRYDQVGEGSGGEDTMGDDVSSDDMGSPADDAGDQGTEPEVPEEPVEEAPAAESVQATWRQKMEMAIFHALRRK
jgi:immediate-early protein